MSFRVVSGIGRDGCIRWGEDRRSERGSFGGKCGASYCNNWGLCSVVMLCRQRWRRSFSQITLGFLVVFHVLYKYSLCMHVCMYVLITAVPSSAAPLANAAKLARVLIDACCTQLSLVNSGVTGRKLAKYLPDVKGSSPLLTRVSALQ